MMEEAFKIIDPNGHVYRIFADGQIEGFEKGSTIFNQIPLLMRQYHFSMASGSPLPIISKQSLRVGVSHRAAPMETKGDENIFAATGEK